MFPVFSVILIALLGYLVILHRRDYKLIVRDVFMVTIILSFLGNYGYFCKVGDFELAHDEFCTFVLFALCLPYFFKGKYNSGMLKIGMLFLGAAMLGLLCTLLMPYVSAGFLSPDKSWDDYVFGRILLEHEATFSLRMAMIPARFILFFCVLSVLKENFTKEDWRFSFNSLLTAGKCMLLFAVAEFILKNVCTFDLGKNLYGPLFGSDGASTFSSLQKRGNLYVLQGFFRETTYFALLLFWLGFAWSVPIRRSPREKQNYFWLILNAALLLVTGAFAATIYFVLLVLFYVIYYCKKSKKAILFTLISLVAVAMAVGVFGLIRRDLFLYYWSRIEGVFESIQLIASGESEVIRSSEFIRIMSMMHLFLIWIQRFFYGLGYGVAWGHSAVLWMLACGGVAGLGIWLYFVFKKFIPKCKLSLAAAFIFGSALVTGHLGMFYSLPYALILFMLHDGDVKKEMPVLGKAYVTSMRI